MKGFVSSQKRVLWFYPVYPAFTQQQFRRASLCIPVNKGFVQDQKTQDYTVDISSTIASTACSGSAAALMGRPITR
jgi:hypothetical protein